MSGSVSTPTRDSQDIFFFIASSLPVNTNQPNFPIQPKTSETCFTLFRPPQIRSSSPNNCPTPLRNYSIQNPSSPSPVPPPSNTTYFPTQKNHLLRLTHPFRTSSNFTTTFFVSTNTESNTLYLPHC